MAVQAPNPRDFKSWEDAFQYPIPVVRRLEQQLRGNISENREKLRSLVGGSYRDLLGTADRIIEMDEQMSRAESVLSDVGQNCNARAVERIARSHARMAKLRRDRTAGRNGLASELTLLQRCMDSAARIVKRNQSSLLASKLLVLARLLHKSASESPDPPPLLDKLRSKLASLRKKLLFHIDLHLASATLETADLVDTLGAYSLATSSTPTDVLRHFLHVRAQALSDLCESMSQNDVSTALDLLVRTLKDAQTVFPKHLPDLLAQLKARPLLQDSHISAIAELDLDIHERWIAESVRKYTPSPRHDQLQLSQASDILKSWGKAATKTLIDGLRRLLKDVYDMGDVIGLRESCLRQALAVDKKTAGLDSAALMEELRSCFLDRMRDVISFQASKLSTIAGDVLDETATFAKPEEDALDLWDPTLADLDLARSAVALRSQINNRRLGRSSCMQIISHTLLDWSARSTEIALQVKGLRDVRWDDDLDITDDLDLDSPQELLSRDDPQSLEQVLETENERSYSSLVQRMKQEADSVWSQRDEQNQSVDTATGGRAIFLLRLLREIMQRRPSTTNASSTATSASSLVETLHHILVLHVTASSAPPRKPNSGTAINFNRCPATTLWEGTPPLPVQLSPACFRFLRGTCKGMEAVGSDLWTHAAVSSLRASLAGMVAKSLESLIGSASSAKPVVNGHAEEETNGHMESIEANEEAETNGAETPRIEDDAHDTPAFQNKATQALFDSFYLEKLLKSSGGTTLSEAIEGLKQQTTLQEAEIERLRKSSTDYCKKTYLLFGMLANP